MPPSYTYFDDAIMDYAAKHGRTWKAQLLKDWMDVRVPEGPLLRRLRNDRGPSWLKRYQLPKPTTEV